MIDISIIIVSWNAKNHLMNCLESIRLQNGSRSSEIIVVDNASTDGSTEAVLEKYPGVVLIQNEKNLGFARANNIGINHSAGKYICLVNSDVKVLNGCLNQLYYFMEKNPSIGIAGPKILNADLSLQISCREFPSLRNNYCGAVGLDKIFPRVKIFSGEHMFYFLHDKIRKVDVLVGCFLMIRRKAMDQVGYLDEQFFIYAEDIDLCRRFWNMGWEVVFFPDAQAIHYRGGSSSNAPVKFSVEQEKSIFQYWAKHHTKTAQLAIFLIMLLQHFLRIVLGSFLYLLKPSHRTRLSTRIEENMVCLRSLFISC